MVAAVPAKTAWKNQNAGSGSVDTGLTAPTMNQPLVPTSNPADPYMIA